MNELEKAWLAGFFDGEGCVMLCRYQRSNMKEHPAYYLRVVLANTDKDILDWVQSEYGGKVKQRLRVKPHHKDNFYLEMSTLSAKVLLEDILPHLRVKREQAVLGIKLAESVHSTWGKTGWHKKLPEELIEYRERLRERVLVLNDNRR